jgi:hypothetical protein
MRVGARTDRTSTTKTNPWLRLYPRAWRDRYGDELLDLASRRPIDKRLRLDLVRGALDAHLHPIDPPHIGILAPLTAGMAWILAGGITLLEPVPPDWPGYLFWTLPIGLFGAIGALRLATIVGRRSGLRAPPGTGPVVLVAIAAHLAWIAALGIAVLGGPYGAITAATQSFAALGTVGVGLLRSRADDHPLAEAVLVAGGAMLVPAPATWILVGVAWLATLLVGRPRVELRPA